VAIIANHQNGRDTHVRGVRVMGPRPHPRAGLGFPLSLVSDPAAGPYATL
jgi:anaphase-promoting complex subunit 10